MFLSLQICIRHSKKMAKYKKNGPSLFPTENSQSLSWKIDLMSTLFRYFSSLFQKMKHYTSRHKVETLTPSRGSSAPISSSGGSSSLFSSSRSIPRSSTPNGHPPPVHFYSSISSHRNFSPIKKPFSAKSPLKNDVKSFYNFTTDLMRDLDGLSKPRGQYCEPTYLLLLLKLYLVVLKPGCPRSKVVKVKGYVLERKLF